MTCLTFWLLKAYLVIKIPRDNGELDLRHENVHLHPANVKFFVWASPVGVASNHVRKNERIANNAEEEYGRDHCSESILRTPERFFIQDSEENWEVLVK